MIDIKDLKERYIADSFPSFIRRSLVWLGTLVIIPGLIIHQFANEIGFRLLGILPSFLLGDMDLQEYRGFVVIALYVISAGTTYYLYHRLFSKYKDDI